MDFLRKNQRNLAVGAGYLLVAALFFGLGKFWATNNPPQVAIDEPAIDLAQIYSTFKLGTSQLVQTASGNVAGASAKNDCQGQIKGNISGSGKIYHLPGGAFYDRTTPEICFDTEAHAREAGFRKSSR